jgi:hypothetical protein
MKRFVIAALAAGLWSASARADDGALAPTAPVVPVPVVQDGKLLGGPETWSGRAGGTRLLSASRWSPFRSSTAATADPMMTEPVPPGPVVGPATPAPYHLPPLPAEVGGADGMCGTAGCGPTGCGRARRGLDLARLKAWLCFHYSPTDLPKCRPTPYVTPLLGMFPCTPYACHPGCAPGGCGFVPPPPGAPALPPHQTPPQQMPPPMPPPQPGTGVTMPLRGTQGATVLPTWQGRAPAATSGDTGIRGYRFAAPESPVAKPALGPVVNTSFKTPAARK